MGMTEYEKMVSGQLYNPRKLDPKYDPRPYRELARQINQTAMTERDKIIAMEKKLFGRTGENLYVNPPVYVDYGFNTYLGENFYANMDCVFLDVAPITIGDDVMLGPKVSLITASHPIDADVRNRGLEIAKPINIGHKVWLGAGVIVNPGVTIGDETIVGSGSVVTKDLPSQVIAVGNPAKVLRKITAEDKKYWEELERAYYDEEE